MSSLLEDQYKFMIITCSVILRMGNVTDRSRRWNQNTLYVQ